MTQEEINKIILDNWDKEGLANGWVNEHIKNNELKQQVEYLQSKIDKAIDKLESLLPMCIMPNNMLIHGTEKAKTIEETLDILKEDKQCQN